jgi:hypothetical protein
MARHSCRASQGCLTALVPVPKSAAALPVRTHSQVYPRVPDHTASDIRYPRLVLNNRFAVLDFPAASTPEGALTAARGYQGWMVSRTVRSPSFLTVSTSTFTVVSCVTIVVS